ncbi:hypothetical protein ACJ6WF_29130 [Streptomyces sp. MMS24-I2-30]|uniref:hypothetical protein n=1 Tax=Streptomyces sp. MMS24-I2-30 TaxID=3351564 RepID=UPI003896E5E1
MPIEDEITRHVAVLSAWHKGDGHSAVFPRELPRIWIPESLLEATAWGDLTEALRPYKLRFASDATGERMRIEQGSTRAESGKYAQMLNDLPDKLSERRGGRGVHREGKEPLDLNLVKYLSHLRRNGQRDYPTKEWADSLPRHDLKMEKMILEGRKSRWYLVDAPGGAAESAAGVGVGERRDPVRSVFPVAGFGVDAGPSSWSAGEGAARAFTTFVAGVKAGQVGSI